MIDREKISPETNSEETLEAAFMRFIRKLFSFLRSSCTFEEFLTKTGEYFDERIILTEQKREGMKYTGGKITFTLSGDKVNMHSELYFYRRAEDKWTVQKSSNSVDKTRFNDWDKDPDLQRLSRCEEVTLDINPPAQH